MLIGHPITNLNVYEALLKANRSTAFPDMGCADFSPSSSQCLNFRLAMGGPQDIRGNAGDVQ